MSPVRTVEVRFQTNLGTLQAEMAAAGASVRGFGGEFLALGETGNRGVRELGFAIAGVGAAIEAVDVLAIKAFAGFDERMRNVASITQDGEAQFKKYESAVLSLSEVGTKSANDLAEGLYHVASAGFTGAAGIAVLADAQKAAEAGLTNTTTAANAITATLNSYGLSAVNAGHVSDILFNTVRVGQTTFGELSQSMGQFIGVAGQLHVPLEQIGAAYSTITIAGVPAAEAGTALNRVLLSLIKPSKDLTDLYHQWGYETGQQALQAKGLSGVIQGITTAAGGNVEKLHQLATDQRAFRGELALTTDSGSLFARQLSQFADVAGQTEKAHEQQAKSLSYAVGVMGNDVKAAGMSMVEFMTGPLKSTANFVGEVAQGFTTLPAPIRDTAGAITVLGSVTGLVVGGVLAWSRSLGAVITSMERTAVATEQVATTLGAIPPAAAAGAVAIQAETAALGRYNEVAAVTRPPMLGGVLPGMGVGGPNAEIAAGGAVQGALPGMEEAGAGVATLGAAEATTMGATTALGAALGTIVPVVGAVALGAVALTTVMAALGHAHRQAAQDAELMKSVAEQEAAGQTQQAEATLVHSTQINHLLPTLHAYGLSVEDVTKAVLGDSSAQHELAVRLESTGPGLSLSANQHKSLEAALRGHKSAADDLTHSLSQQLANSPPQQTALLNQAMGVAELVSKLASLVSSHRISAATARELAGALGNLTQAQSADAQSADEAAASTLKMAETQRLANEKVGLVQKAMAEAGSPTKMYADFQAQLSASTHAANTAATQQQKIVKDQQTIQNDAAQATLDAARSQLQLERANHALEASYLGISTAQKAYNDLVSFGIVEEHERLDIAAASAQLSHAEALTALADAQQKLNLAVAGQADTAASSVAAARAQIELERANHNVAQSYRAIADAQKAYVDLLAYGLAEERQRADIAAQSSILSHTEALQAQADAQLRVNQLTAGPVEGVNELERPKALRDAQNALARANLSVQTTALDAADAQRKFGDMPTTQARELADAQQKVTDSYLSQREAIQTVAADELAAATNQVKAAGTVEAAQDAVAQAELRVRSSALDAADAQRLLNRDDAAAQALKVADAEQKVTDALLTQKEASQTVQADQLAIMQQQTKLAQNSSNAADSMALAADKMAGSIGGAVGQVKGSFDQWTKYQEDQAKKMKTWFDDITYLAIHGHRNVADEMLHMGIETADYAAEAVRKVKSGEGLGGLDAAMTTIAQMSSANFSINWSQGMDDLDGIARLQGTSIADEYRRGLASGAVTLAQVISDYKRLTAEGANALIISFGGRPVAVDESDVTAYNIAARIQGRAAGGIEPNIAMSPTVLYGERETGGEAFIPRLGDSRRMAGVLGEAAAWHGLAVVPTSEGQGLIPMATGGIVNLPYPPALGGGDWERAASQVMWTMHDRVQQATYERLLAHLVDTTTSQTGAGGSVMAVRFTRDGGVFGPLGMPVSVADSGRTTLQPGWNAVGNFTGGREHMVAASGPAISEERLAKMIGEAVAAQLGPQRQLVQNIHPESTRDSREIADESWWLAKTSGGW